MMDFSKLDSKENMLSHSFNLKDIFRAFKILFVPIYNVKQGNVNICNSDFAYAQTAAMNIKAAGYFLHPDSMFELTQIKNMNPSALSNWNPFDMIKGFEPDIKSEPFYPDFPTQVLDMSEAVYRYEQALHYASTYGITTIAKYAGIDMHVREGWRPTGGTAKTLKDFVPDGDVAPKVINLVFDYETLANIVLKCLGKNVRLSDIETRCVTNVFDYAFRNNVSIGTFDVPFKENIVSIVKSAVSNCLSSREIANILIALCKNPGDVFKCACSLCSDNGVKYHNLKTKEKKALALALEHFSAKSVAENIVNGNSSIKRVIPYLSYSRFSKSNDHKLSIHKAVNGEIKTWNSKIEEAWSFYMNDKTFSSTLSLINMYKERPGLFLRSIVRLVRNGVAPSYIVHGLSDVLDSLSPTTMVRLATIFGFHIDKKEMTNRARNRQNMSYDMSNVSNVDLWKITSEYTAAYDIVHALLKMYYEKISSPIKGKKVYIDPTGFDLNNSLILPNENGDMGSYVPAGMAYALPKREQTKIRFFMFWDAPRRRVDVDVHFYAHTSQEEQVHIGWNSNFSRNGMVMSGDITTSCNSVEYLDVDLDEAEKDGIETIDQSCDIFSGACNWNEIKTCFAGCMIVNQTLPSVELYNSDNVIFRDNFDGVGSKMDYATINVPERYIRVCRGLGYGTVKSDYSVALYLKELCAGQDVTIVDTQEEADVVLSVGKSSAINSVSLIDEKFFL